MSAPASLGTLPEELLEQSFLHLASTLDKNLAQSNLQALACLSKTSRQFHRIVEPLLYRNVHAHFIFTGYTDVKTTGAGRLLRTLIKRRRLRKYARTFRATHSERLTKPTAKRRKPRKIPGRGDEYESQRAGNHVLLHKILFLIPHVETMDLTEYPWDGSDHFDYELSVFKGYSYYLCRCHEREHLFYNLKRLDLCFRIGRRAPLALAAILANPTLEVLNITTNYPLALLHGSSLRNPVFQSNIRHISFNGFAINSIYFTYPYKIPLYFQKIATVCPLLNSLQFSLRGELSDIRYWCIFQGIFEGFAEPLLAGTLRTLEMWSEPCKADMRSITPISAENLALWKHPGVKLEKFKMDMHVLYGEISGCVGEDFALPESIVHLTLRHIPKDKRRGPEFVIETLRVLRQNLRRLLPNLQTLELELYQGWHGKVLKANPGGWNFEKEGVDFRIR